LKFFPPPSPSRCEFIIVGSGRGNRHEHLWIFPSFAFHKRINFQSITLGQSWSCICITTKQSVLLLLSARWCLCYLSDKHSVHNLSNSKKFLQFLLAVRLSADSNEEKRFNYLTPKVWMKPFVIVFVVYLYEGVRHEHSPISKLSILTAFKSS